MDVLEGNSEIKIIERPVDLDAKPFIPEGWSLAKNEDGTPCHRQGGKWNYDRTKIKAYTSKSQLKGHGVKWPDLYKELEDQLVINANLLDFYLKHKHLIPLNWNNSIILFCGTTYRDCNNQLRVRYLHHNGNDWAGGSTPIDINFGHHSLALVQVK
ncbi:MAG: hypothetical protein WC827_03055 [Candidatus Paceibacterota bacterium]|jgi:hypothetical protein